MKLKQFKKTLKKPFMPLVFSIRKTFLRNRDFSIISNNCWSGFVYQYFGLKYRTPFIGLFINSPCYIKLLKNLDLLYQELRFIDPSESRYKQHLLEEGIYNRYPIGILGSDIEIHFLHFANPEEVKTKWEKRIKRLNNNNLLVKISEDYFCNKEILTTFDLLPYQNKLCFTARKYPDIKSAVYLPELKNKEYVRNEHRFYRHHMDIVKFLNSMISRQK